jgi:hypothetical protein
MPNTKQAQHNFNFTKFLEALSHITQVLAAVAPIVVAPLAASGTIDPATAGLINQESAAAGTILSQLNQP